MDGVERRRPEFTFMENNIPIHYYFKDLDNIKEERPRDFSNKHQKLLIKIWR